MFYLILALAFAMTVAVFAIQNSLPVTIAFLSWSFQTSLVIVILGAACFGALATLSLAMLMKIKAHWALRRAKQRQGELEAEINTLKARLTQEPPKDENKADL